MVFSDQVSDIGGIQPIFGDVALLSSHLLSCGRLNSYDGFAFARPKWKNQARKILEGVGLDSIVLISSSLGEGGYVVGEENILLVCKAVADSPEVEELRKKGYQVYVMPIDKEDSHPTINTNLGLLTRLIGGKKRLIRKYEAAVEAAGRVAGGASPLLVGRVGFGQIALVAGDCRFDPE